MLSQKASLVVKRSHIQGKGVFAGRDFKKGERICLFSGKPVSVPYLRKTYKPGKERVSCDAFQIGARRYLLLDKPWIFVNHSCSPNAAFKDERSLVATRSIRKGEEIFYDYSATEWTPRDYTEYDHLMWPMKCNCGTSSCRKLIVCFPYLSQRIRQKYLKNGIIQNHILRKQEFSQSKQRCDVCEEACRKDGLSCKISSV